MNCHPTEPEPMAAAAEESTEVPVVPVPDLPDPEMAMPPSDPDDGPGVGQEYPPDPPMPEE